MLCFHYFPRGPFDRRLQHPGLPLAELAEHHRRQFEHRRQAGRPKLIPAYPDKFGRARLPDKRREPLRFGPSSKNCVSFWKKEIANHARRSIVNSRNTAKLTKKTFFTDYCGIILTKRSKKD
jgi:hypothetical protein